MLIASIVVMSIKRLSIYKTYENFQSSGFIFKDPTISDTFNIKLKKKMNLIEQNYKWNKLAFDFWALIEAKICFLFTKTDNLLDCSLVT